MKRGGQRLPPLEALPDQGPWLPLRWASSELPAGLHGLTFVVLVLVAVLILLLLPSLLGP
jgi:hypothetical protein